MTFDFGGVACRLTASVIVYRSRTRYPEGDRDEIADLVPVWWEFHTSDDGGEFLNDFSFSRVAVQPLTAPVMRPFWRPLSAPVLPSRVRRHPPEPFSVSIRPGIRPSRRRQHRFPTPNDNQHG